MQVQPLQIVSIIAVFHCQDKFLLVKRREDDDIFPGKWQNLGGKIELGEFVEQALAREIKEEVGLELNGAIPEYLQSYSWKKDDKTPVRLGLIFLIDLDKTIKDYIIKLDKELADYGWFTMKNAFTLDLIGHGHSKGTSAQLLAAQKFIENKAPKF